MLEYSCVRDLALECSSGRVFEYMHLHVCVGDFSLSPFLTSIFNRAQVYVCSHSSARVYIELTRERGCSFVPKFMLKISYCMAARALALCDVMTYLGLCW